MTTQRARIREWTAEDWNDMQHTGPETLAGQFMRRFWHPVQQARYLEAPGTFGLVGTEDLCGADEILGPA